MLIEFSVENYKSFKGLQTLTMQATGEKEKGIDVIEHQRLFLAKKNLNILKTKAIFGANSSGKSNIVKAMASFWKILNDNLADKTVLNEYIDAFRLDKTKNNSPTYFQIITVIDGIQYRYGFEADTNKIHSEWLFVKEKKEIFYFTREGQKIINYNKSNFKEIKEVEKTTGRLFKENTLILSVLYALNRPISSKIYKSIIHAITINPGDESGEKKFWLPKSIENWKVNEKFKSFSIELLKKIDKSIVSFEIKENSDKSFEDKSDDDLIIIKRKLNDKEASFNLETHEGSGTRKMFSLSYSIFSTFYFGKTLIIDELDARLHPKLTREIISLFQTKDCHPEAQFIFVTHDSNLLDSSLLRRDQITFVDKNKYGVSEIFDLSDVKGVRENDLFEKNYLKGKYGGLPYLNNLRNIFAHA